MAHEAGRQLVVFDLAGEACDVNVGTVREIIRTQAVTHVPETPDVVEGVINRRVRVIPVRDARKRLGLEISEHMPESRIVVVDIAGDDIGVIVEAVTEMLR
jgi:purine-binding chemotaxis protein CheW